MKSHFLKENDVVLSSRWQFQDGRSKGMGTASWAVAQGPKDAGGQYIWFSAPLHCLETYIFEQRNPNFHFALGPAN